MHQCPLLLIEDDRGEVPQQANRDRSHFPAGIQLACAISPDVMHINTTTAALQHYLEQTLSRDLAKQQVNFGIVLKDPTPRVI